MSKYWYFISDTGGARMKVPDPDRAEQIRRLMEKYGYRSVDRETYRRHMKKVSRLDAKYAREE